MILVIHLVVALDLGRYNEFEDGTKALFKEYILPGFSPSFARRRQGNDAGTHMIL